VLTTRFRSLALGPHSLHPGFAPRSPQPEPHSFTELLRRRRLPPRRQHPARQHPHEAHCSFRISPDAACHRLLPPHASRLFAGLGEKYPTLLLPITATELQCAIGRRLAPGRRVEVRSRTTLQVQLIQRYTRVESGLRAGRVQSNLYSPLARPRRIRNKCAGQYERPLAQLPYSPRPAPVEEIGRLEDVLDGR